MKKNHLFFFVQNNKIRLVLKEHIFKNGLLILQNLISKKNNTNDIKIKNVKLFYKLLFK